MIIFILSSCGGLEDLIPGNNETNVTANITNENNNTTQITNQTLNQTTMNATDSESNTKPDETKQKSIPTINEEIVWEGITIKEIEKFCFNDSRNDAGEYYMMVRACICDGKVSTTNETAEYDCEVFTFDPGHTRYELHMICSTIGMICDMSSNRGWSKVALEEVFAFVPDE